MIDSHCHLDHPAFDRDLDCVLGRARAAGVTTFVCAGWGPDRWPRQLELSRRHPEVHPAMGLHPWAVDEGWEAALESLPGLLGQAVAVGEIGLDALRGPRELQERAFLAQLDLARDLGLPIILHAVRCHEAVQARLKSPWRGVVHSFGGSAEQAAAYLRTGLCVSFSASILRESKRSASAVRVVPDDRLLVETDSPDQCPEPGRRNEPARLVEVVARVAEL
ncbi:MAG: TatD family hydrolase, partial [Candidatus Eremiobacterota bacterium]